MCEIKIGYSINIKRLLRSFIGVFAILSLYVSSPAFADTDKISFDVPLPPSLLGEGSSMINKRLIEFQTALKTEAEMEIKFVTDIDSWDKVIARLEMEQTDVAWLPPYYYARARAVNSKSAIRPLVIYKTGRSVRSPLCLYVRKDAGHTNIQDLLAGRVYFPDESSWVALNLIFSEDRELSKYKIDPAYFFAGFRILNRESSARALLFKTTDAIVLESEYLKYITAGHKQIANNIAPLVCSKPLPNTILVYRNGLDERLVESLRLILINMHNYESFRSLRNYFKISNGMWTTASQEDLKPWIDLYREAATAGWDESFKKIAAGE